MVHNERRPPVYLEPIPAYHAAQVWPLVRELAEEAAEESDDYSVDDLYRDSVTGKADMFVIWNGKEVRAAFFVDFIPMRYGVLANAYALSGDGLNDWLHLILDLHEFCKSKGAKRMEIISREGWKKKLAEYGYEVKSIVYSKEL